MSNPFDKPFHKRLNDWENYDRIEFKVVPRYKTSDLSGDEWRQHVEVTCYFKGEPVLSFGVRDMAIALALTPGKLITESNNGIQDAVIKREHDGACDQPSCEKQSVGRFLIKEEFSERGHKLDKADSHGLRYYRQFCKTHLRRGDCGREDSDDNYEPMDAVTADDSTNLEESPSAFGGVIKLDPP